MNPLRHALDEYLTLRHKLGFELRELQAALTKFIAFLKAHGSPSITTALAVKWAQQPQGVAPARHARRLGMVRDFARYVSATDARTEVPPQGLLPGRIRRPQPYIYSPDQIHDLIQGARELAPWEGLRLRPYTYATLFGLLAVTGMRVSEAVALSCKEVDLAEGVLTVRESKCRKTRLVPIHPSTQERLRDYAHRRQKCAGRLASTTFFVSDRGQPLGLVPVNYNFLLISRRIGLRGAGALHGPRLHDLRHTFAVRTLAQWYRSDAAPERCVPLLATYLGHGKVENTYWYLSATPELLDAVSARCNPLAGGQP
jgi:integrase/recombinase XerD